MKMQKFILERKQWHNLFKRTEMETYWPGTINLSPKHTEVETVDLVLKLKNKLVCSQNGQRSVRLFCSHLRW